MDITQLLLSAGFTLGVALVGLMAVVPSVMEARSAQGSLTAPPPAARVRRHGHRPHGHRRHGHRGHQGAAPLAL